MSFLDLQPGDRVVAVRPQTCAGAGWSNRVMWVYIKDRDGVIREACLQPEEQPHDAALFFKAGEAMQDALIDSLR